MKLAPQIPNEDLRLENLYSYKILDTLPEPDYDNIVSLVATALDVPVAFISLVDRDRQWFKASKGLDLCESARSTSFCGHAIAANELFVVPDATRDPRFSDNPAVTGAMGLRFYAGAPLVSPAGHALGTLCAVDVKPRVLTATQAQALTALAKNVVSLLELRSKNSQLAKLSQQYLAVQSMVQAGGWELDLETGTTYWSDEVYKIYHLPVGTPIHKVDALDYYPQHERQRMSELLERCVTERIGFDDVFEFYDSKKKRHWVRSVGKPVLDEKSQVTRIIGTFQDVTLQEERRQNLALVLNNMSEGYFDWHIREDYEYISPRFWEMMGYDPAKMPHHPSAWHSIVHPDDLPISLNTMAEHVRTRGVVPYEVRLRYRHGQGHWIWIKVSARVIEWDADGSPLRMVGTGSDVNQELQRANELEAFVRGLDKYAIIARTDSRGAIIFVNDQFCRISGYEREELLGKDHRILNSGTHGKEFFAQMWGTIKAGRAWRGEIRNRAKNGSFYWVDTTITPLMNQSGGIDEFISIRYDITERKEAAERVLENEARLKSLFDQSADAIMTLAPPSWRFTAANPATLSMFRFASETQFTQLGPWDVSPEYQPDGTPSATKAQAMIKQALEQGSAFFDWVHRDLKGDEIICTVLLSRIVKGDETYIQATVRDVTENFRRQQITSLISDLRSQFVELSSKKRKFFDLLLSKMIGLTASGYGFVGEVVRDRQGEFLRVISLTDISWNPETKKFYENFADVGVEFRNLNTLFGEVIKTKKLLIADEPQRHPASGGLPPGHPAMNSFAGIPIFYNKELIALICLANRPGGYREDYLREFTELFETVGEMIHALMMNQALDDQRRIAIHNSKLATIGEMAAGVGHEINNPLAIISGQLMMLQQELQARQCFDASIGARFTKSQHAIERISGIVKGLRTFARSDTDEIAAFNFSELVHETVEMVRELYARDEVALQLTVEPDLWTTGNRGRLQQVIVNLLSNARDALEDRPLKQIHLGLRAQGGRLHLSVRDTGKGIPEEIKHKIFEPFFTTKEVNKGTGIGLSLIDSIIKEHGGELQLESQIGVGSEFSVFLQISSGQIAGGGAATIQPPLGSFAGTILLVDDEADMRDTLRDVFEAYGATVEVATSGAQALERLGTTAQSFDLILSDVKMPGMDGPTFLQELERRGYPKRAFYFLSGGVNFDTTPGIDRADGVLPKPLSREDITQLLKQHLRASGR